MVYIKSFGFHYKILFLRILTMILFYLKILFKYIEPDFCQVCWGFLKNTLSTLPF